MVSPRATQSTDKKRNDRLVTDQSEALSRRYKLCVVAVSGVQLTRVQEHLGCDRQRCCVHNRSALK